MNDECDYCGVPVNVNDKGLCASCKPVERATLAAINATGVRKERTASNA